jgi:hypothetical protein
MLIYHLRKQSELGDSFVLVVTADVDVAAVGTITLVTDDVAGNGGPPLQSALGGEGLAASFDVGGRKSLDQILGRSDVAGANVGDGPPYSANTVGPALLDH